MAGAALPEALRPLADAPSSVALFCDFDGTLAAIVDDPEAARPVPGAVEVLTGLAQRLGRVAIVSGRPLAFLRRWFGEDVDIDLAGLYGLEQVIGGQEHAPADADHWRTVVGQLATVASAELPAGVRVESKGIALALHMREHPETVPEAVAWAERAAEASGLRAHAAKMAVELVPPLHVDKGTTVRSLAVGFGAVAFVGDDVGDLPAYDALDELAAAGVHAVRVAVRSAEESPVLTSRADLHVDGPAGTVAVLQSLAAVLPA